MVKFKSTAPAHYDLFLIELDRIVNENYPLDILSPQMDWQVMGEQFEACSCEKVNLSILGQPPLHQIRQQPHVFFQISVF